MGISREFVLPGAILILYIQFSWTSVEGADVNIFRVSDDIYLLVNYKIINYTIRYEYVYSVIVNMVNILS